MLRRVDWLWLPTFWKHLLNYSATKTMIRPRRLHSTFTSTTVKTLSCPSN